MEVIPALIGAVLEAVFLPVLTMLELAAAGLAAAVEFAVYSLFQGREKASQRYTQREQDRAEIRSLKVAAKRTQYALWPAWTLMR